MSQDLRILKNTKMMMNFIKMESSFNPENKNGIVDEEKFQDSVSSSSSTTFVSSESDLFEEVNSSDHQQANGPFQDMSSLLRQLPIKRGLSEHYNGKSQSFTSLSNVRCLEDLAKPENPYNNKKKKLKSSKSDGRILEGYYRCRRPSRSKIASRIIPKKTSRGSCGRRNSRPPMPPPHRSSSFTNQTRFFT